MIKFTDMKENNSYDTTLLLKMTAQKTTASGKPFIEMKLSDGFSEITAKMWDRKTEQLGFDAPKIVDVSINTKIYNGALTYDVKSVAPSADSSLSVEDFIIRAPYPASDMFGRLTGIISSLPSSSDPHSIASMTLGLLDTYKDSFMTHAAAKSVHHAIYSGLLFHSLRMTETAMKICDVYKMIDRELLVCGAAIHDIGKLSELSSKLGEADYTPNGRMFGHTYLGMKMIERAASSYSPDKERLLSLLHMVASHHGLLEYGAMTTPATIEAQALHLIDTMDARLYQFEDAYKKTSPGDLSTDKYFGLENQKVFRPPFVSDDLIDSAFSEI